MTGCFQLPFVSSVVEKRFERAFRFSTSLEANGTFVKEMAA